MSDRDKGRKVPPRKKGKNGKDISDRRLGGAGKSRQGKHAELDDDRMPKTADPSKSKRIGRPPGGHRREQ